VVQYLVSFELLFPPSFCYRHILAKWGDGP
jgi:hypothetical protein